MEGELLKQKEAIEAAKREHELEIARLAVENVDGRPEVREDRAKTPKEYLSMRSTLLLSSTLHS